jgi:hypothetical protein
LAEDEQPENEQRRAPTADDISPEDLIRQLKVSDLLLGTLASLVQLGYAKLGDGELPDARLAIEALRALTPVLEGAAAEDQLRDLRQATANLQLAYADAVAKSQPASDPEQS